MGLLCSPKALCHVVADLCGVILADGDGGIVAHRQGVSPDVDHLGSVLPEAIHDVADVLPVQLEEPFSNRLNGHVFAVDPDILPPAGTGLGHQST